MSDPSSPAAAPPAATASFARYAPLLVFAVALALRLYGITWALPDRDRAFSYHPDESVVVGYSLVVNPLLGRLDPGFYNYGSLSLLLNSIFITLARAVGMAGEGPAPGIPSGGDLLAVRTLTALMGAGTCLFLISAGRRLYGSVAGYGAALLYAVAPLAVQHGHFATVDVPATFWIAGALAFAARYLTDEAARPRDLLWAGVWSGLAAATKYNALLVVLACAAVWLLRRPRGSAGALGLLAAGALGGFLLGCPGILLNPSGLIAGIAYEAVHVREGHGEVFTGTLPALLYHPVVNLRWGMGVVLAIAAVVGVVAALLRRRPADLALLAFALPYYLLIGLAEVKFARYTLPLFPPLLLLAASLLEPVPGKTGLARPGAVLVVIGGAYALLFSLALDAVMTRTDTRDRAAAFIREKGFATVAFAKGPWYYSPPLGPLFAHPNPGQAQRSALAVESPRCVPAATVSGESVAPKEWFTELLTGTQPDAVPLNEFEYADALRTGNPEARAFLDAARPMLPNRETFTNPVQVFGLPLANVRVGADGLPVQPLPHDMLYTNPSTVVHYR